MKIKSLSIEVILFIILLSGSAYSSGAIINRVMVGSTSPEPPKIGVTAGDWAIYEYYRYTTDASQHPSDSFLPPTTYTKALCRIEVLKTIENTITFLWQWQTNHTIQQMTDNWQNVEEITADPTVSNTDPPMSVVHVFFTRKDLQPGYGLPSFLEDVSIQVNDTQVFKLGDVSRLVSRIQINYSRSFTSNEGIERRIVLAEFFYDKATGLMLRWDYAYSGLRYGLKNELLDVVAMNQSYVLKETNVWSEPFWLRRDILGGLDIFLLILVIILAANLIHLWSRAH